MYGKWKSCFKDRLLQSKTSTQVKIFKLSSTHRNYPKSNQPFVAKSNLNLSVTNSMQMKVDLVMSSSSFVQFYSFWLLCTVNLNIWLSQSKSNFNWNFVTNSVYKLKSVETTHCFQCQSFEKLKSVNCNLIFIYFKVWHTVLKQQTRVSVAHW